MVTGLLRPTGGEILFDGKPWHRKDLESIGALIESPALYGNLTAWENLKVHTKLLRLPDQRIEEVLETVDLKHTGKKRPPSSLAEVREKKAGNYRSIRTYNLSASALWFGKTTVLAFYTLLSSIALIVATLIAGSLIAQGTVPLGKIIDARAIIWLVSLSIIPIQLFAAAWKGTVAAVGMGLCGLLAGVIAAPKPYWIFVPWS